MTTRGALCAALLLLMLGMHIAVWCGEKTLTLLHTNDMHAAFLPREAISVDERPRPMVGGFATLFTVVDSIRRARGDVLLLDAGDVMTGNPITEREFRGAKGGALFEMMNMIGYDAWCPGNHELDVSQANLRALAAVAAFPTLSANLVNARGERVLGNQPYAILNRGGLRIGIIGVISQNLSSLVIQKNIVGIRVLSPEETVQRWIDELDPATDVLIALTHQGIEQDSALAAMVQGLDIIVGGHSHTRLRQPRVVNGVIVVQAGAYCEQLGILEITVSEDRVTTHSGRLIPLWATNRRPSSQLAALIDSMGTDIEREYSEVIGRLGVDWIRKREGLGMEVFLTEAQQRAAFAEVAFMNLDGVRKDKTIGPITKKDLFEILPFQNRLTSFQLSGRQLQAVLIYHVTRQTRIVMTGIDAEWRHTADGTVELLHVAIGGKPLEPDRMYICTASDYFVGESKRYLGLRIEKPIYSEQTLFQAAEEAIRQAGVITSLPRYCLRQVHQ